MFQPPLKEKGGHIQRERGGKSCFFFLFLVTQDAGMMTGYTILSAQVWSFNINFHYYDCHYSCRHIC